MYDIVYEFKDYREQIPYLPEWNDYEEEFDRNWDIECGNDVINAADLMKCMEQYPEIFNDLDELVLKAERNRRSFIDLRRKNKVIEEYAEYCEGKGVEYVIDEFNKEFGYDV